VFLDISPDAEEGEDLASVKNPPKPHQWAIERHSGEAYAYMSLASHPLISHELTVSFQNILSIPATIILEPSKRQ
jgi:hypothetical protein